MARKWERHYMELRSTIGWAFILFGAFFLISLAYMWPQVYSPEVFNSRMSYHLVLDIEDYWTCDKDYQRFVIDEPSVEENMFQIYIFNISNAANVIQQGYKPTVNEIGPYAYQKKTYKYEIFFDEKDSTRVKFKEFSMLVAIPDDNIKACERMYHRMARSEAEPNDPCINGFCECKSHEDYATIINPLFMKMVWEESAQSILAYFSVDVYSAVKILIENDFVLAAKAHLVPYAIGETYQFRWQCGANEIVTRMFDNLKAAGYSIRTISQFYSNHTRDPSDPLKKKFRLHVTPPPQTCGLTMYSKPIDAGCPIDSFNYVHLIEEEMLDNDAEMISLGMGPDDVAPSYFTFLNPNSEISFLDPVKGAPGYLALAWYLKILEFNSEAGHTMFNSTEALHMLQRRTDIYAEMAYGPNFTRKQWLGARIRIISNVKYIASVYEFNRAVCKEIVYNEFKNRYTSVSCNGHGDQCVWQWGYMRQFEGTDYVLSTPLVLSLIDIDTKLNTNPNNLQYLGNSAGFYNSHIYCTKVYREGMTDPCYDLDFTYNSALVTQPAAIFGVANGIDTVNMTKVKLGFDALSAADRNYYFLQTCNISSLLHEVYPNKTDFHDKYVVRYLNKYRDVGFTHEFRVGNWEEIGYAQFGGGFITDTLTFVRAVYQVTRDGMWHFGSIELFAAMMEYSSWAIKVGYPQAWIYNPLESKALLAALADRSEEGIKFRRHIVYTSTTFVGDGIPSHYINAVGDIGELAFTSEANRGDFSCNGTYSEACGILNTFYNSSVAAADQVNGIFKRCLDQVFAANPWVENCARFETSMTSPQQGIQVSDTDVYGHEHPYLKSRGNVLYEMMFSLTTDLRIKAGLWCPTFVGCHYAWGGMFTTARVREILFQGFTEPSVLRYLNMKHESDGIKFECAENSVGDCGKELLRCNHMGIIMTLPGGLQRAISYAGNQKDEYFAPYLDIVAGTNEMIWEYSMNETAREYAQATKYGANSKTIVQVRNPYWTAYPAWNTNDVEFQKYFQCQKRTLGGLPGKFRSCFDTLNTGRLNLNDSRNQVTFFGNDTLYFFDEGMNVNGSTYMAHPMYLWDGFLTYNYSYKGVKAGTRNLEMQRPRVFIKLHSISLELNQNMFIYDWQKNIMQEIPISDTYTGRSYNRTLIMPVRRFVEWEESWAPLGQLGSPKDSYGMKYIIPRDMASLERLAGFPIFAGTPHAYGNKLWGGTEYGHVQGYSPRAQSQRTFIDYDPITGRSMRQVVRQQINIRIEKGPLYPNVFSSQQRCIAPTKAFSANTGYGCFAYVPLLWLEDSRVISSSEYYRLHDHFYKRPERASVLELIGTVIGTLTVFTGLCMVLNEAFHRRNFKRRVYVD